MIYLAGMTERQAPPHMRSEDFEDASDHLTRIATARDKTALAQLFAHYGPRIKSMMMRLGADSAQAEDLVQETLLAVWRKAHLYEPGRGAASTWIFTIARNLRIDHVRRLSNRPYAEVEALEIASPEQTASAHVEERQIVSRVSEALKALPAEQQEVVRLSYMDNLAHAKIAEQLDIPLGTVKSRLRLAYERLRPLLEDLH